ncbi:EH signature domain-containing protein [Methylocystis sp. ATCC 49242]|uniref:EH signature domain-containing protein n=1 Tax=Methylocystis sp. ATCC 49242 TaxID=622637 RepID=UPI0001F88825|nr:EH signature domain-containing protein [Methylocystis sp. ATCC 49242]
MSLASILEKLVRFNAPTLPDLKSIETRKNAILNRWPDVVAMPNEEDRERLVQEMLRRLEANAWDDTWMSFVTSAARALFDEQRRERLDLAKLRQFYYDEIDASTRRSFLVSMLSVYLGSYQPGATHTRSLASALISAWPRIGPQGHQLLQNIPELLDPVRAPDAIAAKMRNMVDCWTELKAIGIRTPHAPGLMDYAHLAFVEIMRPELKSRAGLEKLFNWLKPGGQRARMSGAGEAITAVLSPWLKQTPPQSELTFITESLLGLYGDPRVSGGGAWAGVLPDHLAVLMRWLTGENIRFFLDVLSVVDKTNMWAPRRELWLSLYEEKRIDAAWVAFGAKASDFADSQLKAKGGVNTLQYGRQVAGGHRKDTSLLIMQIGNRIVVEGSHDYKVHIFKSGNPHTPKLYQTGHNRGYDCDDIRKKSDAAKRHWGNWQDWVKENI